jgi:hypothetical protein
MTTTPAARQPRPAPTGTVSAPQLTDELVAVVKRMRPPYLRAIIPEVLASVSRVRETGAATITAVRRATRGLTAGEADLSLTPRSVSGAPPTRLLGAYHSTPTGSGPDAPTLPLLRGTGGGPLCAAQATLRRRLPLLYSKP